MKEEKKRVKPQPSISPLKHQYSLFLVVEYDRGTPRTKSWLGGREKGLPGPTMTETEISRFVFKNKLAEFPSGTVDKSPPANVREKGPIPGPGRFYTP